MNKQELQQGLAKVADSILETHKEILETLKIADQIIRDYEPELRLIFNLEDK